MTEDKTVALVTFVFRCTAAATMAYLLADAIGFPHPLWTCVFALVGSQDSESAIVTAIGGRIAGTIIGIAVAVSVGATLHRLGLNLAWQIAVAVAICAMLAWSRPAIQLCMWTPPIIWLTMSPTESLMRVGFYRGCEVVLGLLIGGLFLVAANKGLAWGQRASPRHRIKS